MDEKCLQRHHPLIVVSRLSTGYDCEKVIRWCPKCGAIVIDMEYDGRLSPGYYQKMILPELAQNMKNSN